jgi:serine/threonine-protein kinase
VDATTGTAPANKSAIGIAVVVGLVLTSLLAALGVWWNAGARPTAAPNVLRLSVPLPEETKTPLIDLAVSRDGKRLVWSGLDNEGSSQVLYFRELDRFDTQLLRGTEGARQPFFSPDGEWIGFFSDSPPQGNYARPGRLKKVAVRGGPPVILAEASALGGHGRMTIRLYSPARPRVGSAYTESQRREAPRSA